MKYDFDVRDIDIRRLIENETKLSFKRKVLQKCPFCGSGSGSKGTSAFSVQTSKNIFKCFACDKGGNSIEFIKLYKNLSDVEAINYLKENYSNMPVSKKEPMPEKNKTFDKMLFAIKQNELTAATKYLKSRGIDTNKTKGFYFNDKLENAVAFFDYEEKLINKRLIKPDEGKNSHKNASGSIIKNAIYSATFLPEKETVIISEKPIDALTIFCYGYSVISVFSANGKIDDVEKLSKFIEKKHVILSFDNDPAGNSAIEYYKDFIIQNIPVASLQKFIYPEKTDANDLQQKGVLQAFLNDAVNYEILKKDFINEAIPDIIEDSEGERIFFSKAHKYYKTETKGKHTYKTNISNFDMQILYHLKDGSDNTRRLIKMQRHTLEIEIFEIQSSDLTGEKFKTIIRSRGDRGFSFTGYNSDLESILTYLYDFENTAIPLFDAGYYPEHEIFSFADILINKNNDLVRPNEIGILSDNEKCFYLAKASKAVNKKTDTDFTYKEGIICFKEYADLIFKAYGIDGIIGLCFFINSLFRDFIFSVIGRFPFLYLYGEPGTGKTSFVDILRSPYNKNDLGHALNTSTYKALGRVVSQHENYIVYFKEYSPNIIAEILELLKTSYDGSSYSRAQKSNDNSIYDGKCKSAIILDGNSLPTYEAAIFDRIILLDFDNAKFTEEQKKAHSELKTAIEKGTSQIIKEVIKHRATFTAKFKNTYNHIFESIKRSDKEHNGEKIKEIRNRTIEHTAFLLATYKIYSELFDFPVNYKDISTKIIDYAIEKEQTLNTIKPISVFWNAINYNLSIGNMSVNNILIDEMYLYIKLENLYPLYSKYCRENHLKPEDVTGLKKLMTSKNNPSFVPGNRHSQNKNVLCHTHKKIGSCYRFLFEKNDSSIFINNTEINIDFNLFKQETV